MISVVIPAYNEAKRIGRGLQSLVQQDYRGQYEVIVVDNASTDNTAQVAAAYANRLPLVVLTEAKRGRGTARATGCAAAKGDIICSTDADTRVPADWLSQLAAGFVSPEVVAVTGSCAIDDCSPWTNRFFNWFQPQAMRLYRLTFGHYWLTGSNFAIRANIYRQAGGFNPALRDLEDIDLGFRVQRLGKIIKTKTTVLTSGERFRGSLLAGLGAYVKVFIGYFFLKRSVSRD